jgi:hypothetical protein
MVVQLIKISDSESSSPGYCIEVDGRPICKGETNNYDEAKALYDAIVDDPNYLDTRETILHSAIV